MQNLQQKQMHRHGRPQHPLPPGVTEIPAVPFDGFGRQMRGHIGLDPLERVEDIGDHPWPSRVIGVVANPIFPEASFVHQPIPLNYPQHPTLRLTSRHSRMPPPIAHK